MDFLDEHDATAPEGWLEDKQALAPFAEQFDAYFAGELQAFWSTAIPTGTPFQQQVWHSLATIAYGETISYGEQALRLGKARAVQAVGAANGRKPAAHSAALPSGHRQEWPADRLCRRLDTQTLVTGFRKSK